MHAVAVGPDGRVYAATSPDGAVYAIDAAGKATRFFDPPETYIWALAFDRAGALYVATGGEGRVHRVSADGKSETVLASTETHILSLAVDARGRVYAGSAPEGLVYRIDGPGKVFVLLDSAFREIKALDVGDDGSLYAAAIDGRTTESPAGAPTPRPPPPAPAAVVAEVTVSESYAVVPPRAAPRSPWDPPGRTRRRPRRRAPCSASAPRVRSTPCGARPTTSRTPLVRSGPDVLVGTGNKGKVYRVGDDGRWALVATLPAEQVTALARTSSGGVVLVTANPARVFSLDATLAAEGTFLSKVKDTETVSSWGQRLLGGHRTAGNGGPRPDEGGQHGDPGLHLDRLVAAGDPRAGRAHPQREGALPPAAPHPRGQGGGEPDGRGGGRGVPAAQPAPGREVDHRPPRRRGLPEADLRERRARDPRPRHRPAERSRGRAAASRRQPSRDHLQPQALPARPAHLLLAGGGPERRRAPLRRGVPRGGRRAVAAPAHGPRGAGLRLGHGDGAERALPAAGRRVGRPGQPARLRPHRLEGQRLVRGGQPPALDRGDARSPRETASASPCATTRAPCASSRRRSTPAAGRRSTRSTASPTRSRRATRSRSPRPPAVPRIVVLRATDLLGNVATARVDVP